MGRKLFTFRWDFHPHKTPEWFEEQRLRLSPDAFAREILISYDFSVSGVVFSEFSNDHILEGDYQFNPDLPVYRAVDFGRTCAALFSQRDSYGRFIFFKEVILEPSSTSELAQTVRNLSYQYASHASKPYDTCDPAGNTVSFTANTSDIRILNDYDIYPKFDKIQQSRDRLQEGVSLIKYLLSERGSSSLPNIRVSRKGCPKLIEAFQSGYRYKTNKSTGETLDTIDERHPYEDLMDCLRYTLMQFSQKEPPKKPLTLGTTKFEPTKGYHNRHLR
jgi:hypothetical protein